MLDRTFNFLETLIDILVKRLGEKYAVGKLIIQDVKEWIERDANFGVVSLKRQIFREQIDNGLQPVFVIGCLFPNHAVP